MQDIIAERRGFLGLITLNRSKALNALTTQMCAAMHEFLQDFSADAKIAHVMVRSSQNGRFFCAGGDIRALYSHIKDGIYDDALTFFRTEYRLNRLIARYPKPYISLIDGIVMGGGVGISGHGTYRVVTANTIFAMPEVAIGFFPDVGASKLLAQLPHHVGAYLALTGERIKGCEMMSCGLASHFGEASDFEFLLDKLGASKDARAVLESFSLPPPPSALETLISKIETYFSAKSAGEIQARLLRAKGDEFAEKCLAIIAGRSPTSMAVAVKQIVEAPADIEETLKRDYRIAYHIIRDHDFAEGVRALLIDKDQKPRWQPATLENVRSERTDAYFSHLAPSEELSFSW